MEWPRGMNCIKDGWWECIVYITSRRRTVRLGLLQGLYERFLIRNLIRYSPPTQAGLYRDGPLQYYFLHGQAGGLGHLMQYSICVSTMPRAQNRAEKG